MKIKITETHIIKTDDEVVQMENTLEMHYNNEFEKMAIESQKRMNAARQKRQEEIIRSNDIFAIEHEMDDVSTYELLKMIVKKIGNRFN